MPVKQLKNSVDAWDISKKRTKEKQGLSPKKSNESIQLDIVVDGDICLNVEAPSGKEVWRYRVSSQILITKSPYFKALLQTGRYSEGIAFDAERQKLLAIHNNDLKNVPLASLPIIRIADFGAIPNDASPEVAFETMLQILHSTHHFKQPIRVPLIAILAVIADRFDVSEPLGEYLKSQELFMVGLQRPYNKMWSKSNNWTKDKTEEFLRQILFISLTFGIADIITHCSSSLLICGYRMCNTLYTPVTNAEAMWWSLPNGLEEELIAKRNSILATLASLQQHFITLYSNSKTLQCTLGYDTSPACDSFQLGEMIRFFCRCGTLKLSNTFYQPDTDLDLTLYPGNLFDLYEILKSCPSPQIDSNHKRCGLRPRFIPALEHIFYCLGDKVEVCGDCWIKGKKRYAWSQNPCGGKWKFNEKVKTGKMDVRRSHGPAREMFTAEQWDWTLKADEEDEDAKKKRWRNISHFRN